MTDEKIPKKDQLAELYAMRPLDDGSDPVATRLRELAIATLEYDLHIISWWELVRLKSKWGKP